MGYGFATYFGLRQFGFQKEHINRQHVIPGKEGGQGGGEESCLGEERLFVKGEEGVVEAAVRKED